MTIRKSVRAVDEKEDISLLWRTGGKKSKKYGNVIFVNTIPKTGYLRLYTEVVEGT